MSQLSSREAIAASVAIASSSWLSGNIVSISTVAIPGLLDGLVAGGDTTTIARQWHGMYLRGKAAAPRLALVPALGYGYLWWLARAAEAGGSNNNSRSSFLVAAGVLTLGIVPFTLATMGPTNSALIAVATGAVDADRSSAEAVRRLLLTWRRLNLVRSCFPLAGTALAIWCVFG